MSQEYMKTKPVLPLVLSMSGPMILSMLVSALYNIIDTYFVAKIGEAQMTALSLVFPIQNLSSAVAIGFGIGVNAAISISLGAKKRETADKAASLGVFLSILHGLLLTVFCIGFMPAFLRMYHPTADVLTAGLQYTNIVFLFAVMQNVAITYEKIFQAVGRMTVSMLSMLVGCITNIILDPLLIFGIGFFPEMGMRGAALATGIGQTVTLVIYLIIFHVRPTGLTIRLHKGKGNGKLIRKLYSVGIPATLNLALSSVLITALNSILAGFSQLYVLVLGVYYKLQTFIYLTANGIIQGMRPIIGYNYGAREEKRVKDIFRVVLILCASIMAVGMLICLLVPGPLMGLFSKDPAVITTGAEALRIISLGFIVSAVSVAVSGALEGIGKGMPSLVISLLRYVVVIIPAAYLFSRGLGARGVWIAFPVTELITAVISLWLYKKYVTVPKEWKDETGADEETV